MLPAKLTICYTKKPGHIWPGPWKIGLRMYWNIKIALEQWSCDNWLSSDWVFILENAPAWFARLSTMDKTHHSISNSIFAAIHYTHMCGGNGYQKHLTFIKNNNVTKAWGGSQPSPPGSRMTIGTCLAWRSPRTISSSSSRQKYAFSYKFSASQIRADSFTHICTNSAKKYVFNVWLFLGTQPLLHWMVW